MNQLSCVECGFMMGVSDNGMWYVCTDCGKVGEPCNDVSDGDQQVAEEKVARELAGMPETARAQRSATSKSQHCIQCEGPLEHVSGQREVQCPKCHMLQEVSDISAAPEWRCFADQDAQRARDPSRVGGITSYAAPSLGAERRNIPLMTVIGGTGAGAHQLQISQKRSNSAAGIKFHSTLRTEAEAIKETMRTHLRTPGIMTDTAELMYLAAMAKPPQIKKRVGLQIMCMHYSTYVNKVDMEVRLIEDCVRAHKQPIIEKELNEATTQLLKRLGHDDRFRPMITRTPRAIDGFKALVLDLPRVLVPREMVQPVCRFAIRTVELLGSNATQGHRVDFFRYSLLYNTVMLVVMRQKPETDEGALKRLLMSEMGIKEQTLRSHMKIITSKIPRDVFDLELDKVLQLHSSIMRFKRSRHA